MKVERKEVEFQPVTITLESQEEVDMLADMTAFVFNNSIAAVHGSSSWKCREFYSNLYDSLEESVSDTTGYVFLGNIEDGIITLK